MNWLCTFLFIHIVSHVSTIDTNLPISNFDVSIEIPKPIPPMVLEELDRSYRKTKKLKWQTGKSKKPSMVDIALEVAAREGIHAMTDLYQNIEPQIVKNGQILEDNHPAALLSKFSAPVEGNERSAMAAFATLSATKAFRRNNKESTVLGRQAQSQKVSFRRTPLEGLCPPRDPPTCMPASQRYRTHDGTCNNRRRLRWGSSQMPFNRFLPPEYGDGVDSIRGSVEGGALSSARFVSLLVHGAKEGDAPLTLMIVQWGQLLDHDMTSTAQPRSINGSVPSCCGSKDFHPLCFPIKVPLDDPWLAPLKVRCLEFLRSAPAQRRDCVLSWREQTNQVTSFIDASPIYSSNAKTSDNARIFRNGLLIYGRGDPADDVCMRGAMAHQCIRSGDGRSGEQPGLLALHHVWVGEHNRIAMELSILNPHWSDEKVYQETRRIIGALFQHITFREFLPIVLGREVCKLFDLDLVKSGYYTGYDANINPSVSNAFAAAAFRFGHSLVQNTYMRCDRNHNFINNNVTLHEEFQKGDIGTAGSLHRLLRGMATQKALKRDEFITPELTNHLFQTPGFPFGLDLAAINIQRGRDHGIAPYTAWRQPCGLSAIDSWDDLSNVVGPESAKRISHAYRNVHDIDLFVGGIAERPVVGGLVGPTFACIIAQQFSNSRKGDRFWYENSGFESSFTPAQLNALRHVSLSSVLCRAINGGTLQPYVFLPNDFKGNQRIKCGKDPLEPIDLRPWLEQDPFLMSNQKIDQNVPSHSTPISNQLTTKEEKGINNRIQNVTMVANVDFIPNSSIGFHRVTNMTKIHDKLDMGQKLVALRPIVKPIRGISNKLDKHRLTVKKNPKPTASSALKRISTTRRTVVIHNVQIELRSANGANKELTYAKEKTDGQQNSLASTAQNTILKVAGVVKSQISAAMGLLSDSNDDISTKHLSRKMNEQSAASTKLTNSTILSNLTNPIIQTETNNSNLTTERFFNSKNEPKVNNSKDKLTTELVTNDARDNSADLKSKNIENTKEATCLTDETVTKFDNSTERPNQMLNITSDQTTPTKLNDTTKEMNETDITKAKLTNLRSGTSQNVQNFDPTIEPSIMNNAKMVLINNSSIINKNNATQTETNKNDLTAGRFSSSNNENLSDKPTTELVTNDTHDISTDNKPLAKSDISTERTNKETTPTKLTNTTKKLNESDISREELTNLNSRQYFDSNIEYSGKHNNSTNLTANSTIISNNIDPETNDSKTLIPESFKDNKHVSQMINDQNYLLMTTENTSETSLDQTKNSTSFETKDLSDSLRESHDTYKDFQDIINSALQDSLDQHKRVHRKTDHKNLQVELHTNLDFVDKLRTLNLDKTNDFEESQKLKTIELDRIPEAEVDLNENYFTEADDNLNLPTNTEQPSATLRNIELRQFQERPIYNRPQKLLLDTPKSDQYEIEINIRQTNTKPPQNNNAANYEDYNSPNKRYDKDQYHQNYDYINPHQNSPSNSYFTPTTRIPYGIRTKPPTIIYIDEHDERTTTRGPGIFQNILSFATNSFNGIKQQTTSTKSPFNHNPNRIVNNGQNPASENYLSSNPSRPFQHSKPSSGNYLSAQQAQTYPPNQGFPQHGFSQGPPNYNPALVPPQGFPHQNVYPPQALPGANSFSTASNIGGVSHASSNAVSTGNFGAIAGSASSSGGDSTFSFNIRPSPRPQLNLMSPAGIKPDYEHLPNRWSQHSSTPASYAVPPKPMPSVESFEYPPNKHDPFSSYTRRPPPYYNKIPSNVFDPAYDDIGRSELTIDEGIEHDLKPNQTRDNEDFDSDDYDYNDDDSFGPIFRNDNAVEEQESSKNDKIDYLKLAEQALTNRTKLNATELDDNFVLPVLRRNDKFIEPIEEDLTATNLPTGEQKSLGHDILAEDYDELWTARSSFLDTQTSYFTGQWNKLKKSTQPVAFAPIQILTKPERPDNWVIFDDPYEKPLLPVQPDFNTDTLVAAEVPMPFQKHKITQTSTRKSQMRKPNDKNFSKDSFDITTVLPIGQYSEEFVTEAIIYKLTTRELDETTEINDSLSTTSESGNLEIKDKRQEIFNFGTEETDSKYIENSTDIANTLQTDSLTDARTDELTTLPNLT